MVDALPAPMLSPDVDLRDFAFMPLDVRRLLNSETWIEASEEPKFAHVLICLWCESWHQVPAASLPDNDIVLARLAMCDKSTWLAIKDKALSGFVKCSDGRYYHPTVVEKAKEAWERKQSQRARTRKATAVRNEHRNDVRDVERNGVQGTVDRDSRKQIRALAPDGAFERFWSAYPKRKSKGTALKAWNKLKPNEQLQDRILDALERAKTSADWRKEGGKFVPYPASWLNAQGWEDEIGESKERLDLAGAL